MSTLIATGVALKEWSAVAHALLAGRQTVLLRKGGIHEKTFDAAGASGRFLLFPTVAHSHRERVRAEHHDLLAAGEADVADDVVVLRCGLQTIAVIHVERPEGLAAVEDLHIWTAESVRRDRLDFRPRQRLVALVVRAFALPRPVRLPRIDGYAGCRSWLELPVEWDGSGLPVHTDDRLQADAARVREAVR